MFQWNSKLYISIKFKSIYFNNIKKIEYFNKIQNHLFKLDLKLYN